MVITAIDPGTTMSGIVVWNGVKPTNFGKFDNRIILTELRCGEPVVVVIEEINPYTIGMSIRDTIIWSGRFQEAVEGRGGDVYYIHRREVIKHLCGVGSGVGDKAVKAALQDRFAYGVRNHGKGTKKEPGFFYGFAKDAWDAFALAVTWYDKNNN